MAPSPKLDPSSFTSIDYPSPQSLLLPTKRPALPFRRNRRIAILLSLPLSLLLIYFLLPSLLEKPHLFSSYAVHTSYASKEALQTTIVLPKLQYKFREGEGADFERRQKVKESIQRTWELYAQEAWGWDEVKPITGGGRDTRSSL
jgi:hypothetical protein